MSILDPSFRDSESWGDSLRAYRENKSSQKPFRDRSDVPEGTRSRHTLSSTLRVKERSFDPILQAPRDRREVRFSAW